MSRTLKRVSLNFKWELNKVWKGYKNPFYKQCPDCGGRGETKAYIRLESLVRLLMLSGSDSIDGKSHPYFTEASYLFDGGSVPGVDMAELTGGLAGRKPEKPFGHDSMDTWNATKKIIKVAGFDPKKWGICKTCNGESIDPKFKQKYNEWKEYEPPKGKGYQLWEDCSEGSPVSPVFKSLDELCAWAENNATTFGREKTTKENWKKMLISDNVHHKSGNMVFM